MKKDEEENSSARKESWDKSCGHDILPGGLIAYSLDLSSNVTLVSGLPRCLSVIESSGTALLRHSSNRFANSGSRLHQQIFVSKIRGDQIIRPPASANVDLGSGGTYQITVGIERVQKTRLIRASIWLNSLQRVFVYEK